MSDLQTMKNQKLFSYVYLVLLTLGAILLVRGTQALSTALDGDAGNYLFTAQSILDGSGITTPTGEALTIFPPGYPLLLALLGSVGIAVTTAATAINLIAIAIMVPGTYLLARMTLGGYVIPLIAATTFATNAATIRVFSNAWTEPPFMVLMLVTLILLVHITKLKSLSWPVAITIGTLISLATTLRFVGLFMIPVVILSLWIATKPKTDFIKIVSTTAISLIGIFAVGIRNLFLGVPLMGERTDGALTAQGSLEQFVRQLGVYIAPPDSTSLTNIAGAFLFMALIASVWLVVIRRERALYPVTLYLLVFWVGIMWSQTSTRIDVDPERLGSPAFVAVILLGIYALRSMTKTINDQFALRFNRPQQLFGNALLAVTVVVIIALNLVNSLRLTG
jgi:hypothetical protein